MSEITQKTMKSLRRFSYHRPILFFLLVLLVSLGILNIQALSSAGLLETTIKELLLAGIGLGGVSMINGRGELDFSVKGFGYALRIGWLFPAITLSGGGLLMTAALLTAEPLLGNPFLIFIQTFLYTLAVGLFEESLFRGLLMNALLIKRGDTVKGILTAVALSAMFFGFIHTYGNILGFFLRPGSLTVTALLQILMKGVQTGIVGFVLGVIYLMNHNLWSISILHMLNDFFIIFPAYLYTPDADSVSYVQEDVSILYVYIFVSLLTVPLVFVSIRELRKVSLPQPGMYRVGWFPLRVKK